MPCAAADPGPGGQSLDGVLRRRLVSVLRTPRAGKYCDAAGLEVGDSHATHAEPAEREANNFSTVDIACKTQVLSVPGRFQG